ncbi:hypothetical protein BC833DRAFT_619060 [Globomyces pollinis-pini]|nr:hypothetical protein BC833DRAFT_619060 [Globomyces pollinis-pini]
MTDEDIPPPDETFPCKKGKWTYYKGLNLKAIDAGEISATKPSQCETACLESPSCNGYTFVNNKCFLKRNIHLSTEVNHCFDCISAAKCGSVKSGTTCTKWGWNFYDKFNLMGHDLENFPTDTKQQCELACHNRDACNGFSYLINNKHCYLKTEVHDVSPELNPSGETESAVACGINSCTKWGWSFFDDQNIMGHDVKLELADNANHCQKYCLSRDDCNAYSYVASDRKCWLKNDVDYMPETNPAKGVKSGVKCGTKKCTKWGYNFWDNNNIMGHDLYTVQADDVPLCQTHCRNDDRCNAYSLSGSTCYLKTGVEAFPAVNEGPGMRSGVMCGSNTCTQWGWRFFDHQNIEGHDLSVKESNDRNLCQKYCLEDDKCNAYTWIQGDNKCYLKQGVMSEPITSDSGVSYSAVRCGTKRCNSDGWNYFDFHNIMGKDLKTVKDVEHRNSCQGHCKETEGCNGYTWINGVCYLKKDVDYYPYTNPSGVAYSARFCGAV